MCGIYGYVNFKGTESSSAHKLHSKSLEEICHRGPDNSTLRFYNTKNDEKDSYNVALGHNRLSIIDLNDSANQPYEYEDFVVVFNGEIYNYIELRDQLILEGEKFETNSDTEVLLKLFIKHGELAFNQLNGMWALAILNKKTNHLTLSRDRFGIKPLYYTTNLDGKLIFSSEIKQILHHIDKCEPNLKNIKDYLALALLDHNNQTFFEGIHKLPVSTIRTIDLTKASFEDVLYWDINKIKPVNENYEDAVAKYESIFESAVNIRLRADVQVGNTLSGGLDSSSIAVVAQRSTSNLLNFSVVSKQKEASEEIYVDELIKKNNVNVQKISSDILNPWEKLDIVIYHHDEPILSFSAVNHFNMMEKVKQQTDLTVILSGQGGDEGLCGYGKYMVMNILDAKKKSIISFFRELYHAAPRLIKEFNFNLSKRYLGKFFPQQKHFNFSVETPKDFSTSNEILKRQISDYQKYSVPPLCHYEDRNSMAYALEIRLPFLDYRLVEFSLGLPTSYKIKKGVSKRILRDAIKELPKLISERKAKMGFNIPEKEYFKLPEAKKSIDKVLDKNSFIMRQNLLSQNTIDALASGTHNKNTDFRLYQRIIFLELWARRFGL